VKTWLFALSFGALPAAAQITLPAVVVSATRAPQPPAEVPFSLVALPGDALRAAPAATLDDALRAVPGFSLFRRSDSLTANPTAQGVSLRGLGPSGASRSLVLLDGVPLNDPFGGWVNWSLVPRESLAGAEMVPGGGATAWGNAALGGVVQLFTEPASASRSRASVTFGDFSARSAEFALTQSAGPGTLQLSGRDFSTGGFALVAPEDRGPVDIAAWSRHHWLGARWSQPVGPDAELTFTGRTYAEQRGNGTAYQRNSSRENFGSVNLAVKSSSVFGWTATAYAQDQSFSSTFSSVNATRTTETPASNQFAVPATAFGAAWTGVVQQPDGARTSFGADLRRVEGETREHFTFANGDFTRQRIAGGTQDFAGVFALHERPLAPDLRLTLGARLDRWEEINGHRRETDRATGAVLRDDHYAGRNGIEFSPSAGLVWQAAKSWRLRVAAQQAFRRPTLNELYRPFRVGSVITEANAALRTERVTSAELGADYTSGTLTLGAALFWNELHDAVGNVTLAHGPGTFPIVGFVPAGGLGRQRLNLDRTRVQGAELSARWQPLAAFSFNAAFLYDDASVQSATVAPALAGKRLAQVPRQSATLGATWHAPGGLTLTPRVRWLGRQFEDDENQLILGSVIIADLNASYALGSRAEIFLNIENIGDARIETGRSTDGIVNTGMPRFAFGGFRTAW
jgi:outer membrane receptor protein involved in Fe transport